MGDGSWGSGGIAGGFDISKIGIVLTQPFPIHQVQETKAGHQNQAQYTEESELELV